MMKRLYLQLKKAILFFSVLFIYSLILVGSAGAPPPPPPPPNVPAGGDVAQAVVIGAIAAYGAWRLWKRK